MRSRTLLRAVWAGLAYFGVVFAAGFALGTLRVLALIRRLGENAAVLFELPIILALSWMSCRWLITRFDIPSIYSVRLVMGGLAFVVLMFAEVGVSALGFWRTVSAHLVIWLHHSVMLKRFRRLKTAQLNT